MDLEKTKEVCGTCKNWGGKRDVDGCMCKVSPSSRGMCQLRGKAKPPHGGCDDWSPMEGEQIG